MGTRGWGAPLIAILTAVACQGRADSELVIADSTAAVVEQSDSSCGLVASSQHADPALLLDEYLRRDGAGEFLRSNEWLGASLFCPNHVPGWDQATIIAGYESAALARVDTAASFTVRYSRIGRLTQDSAGFYLIEQPDIKTDTFRLVHTRFGWRIAAPVQHQHILPAAALALRRVHADTRTRLTEFVGR